MFPQLTRFTDFGLPLLRLTLALIFITSGWSDLTRAEERSQSIGMTKAFTFSFWGRRARGRPGRSCWSSNPAGCTWIDRRDARRHSEKDLRLAHGVLGKNAMRMAL
jgi:hypothetical protein